MKYYQYNGYDKKFRIFPSQKSHQWVAINVNNFPVESPTFETRKEALDFCEDINKSLKNQHHYKTYKIKESFLEGK